MTGGGPEAEAPEVCYRHPQRAAGVRCTRCERRICPDCMVQAPVGWQCPECVRGAPKVMTMRTLRQARARPILTTMLVAVNVAVYLPALAGSVALVGRAGNPLLDEFALHGPAVADGEWWRLVTSGFLHLGLLHLGFNMALLWMLGAELEPALGRVRYGLVYLAGLLGGSVGALLLSYGAVTAGASGAVFGLMGTMFLAQRRIGIDPFRSGIGGLLLINLLFTFAIPGISVGGHLGGLVGGALAGAVALWSLPRR